MRAIIWDEKYTQFSSEDWGVPIGWLIDSLQSMGVEVFRHPKVELDRLGVGDTSTAHDLYIFTHTTAAHLVAPPGPSWFLKSAPPTKFHTTVDELGYGPYSSITYRRPPYDNIIAPEIETLFAQSQTWFAQEETKWGPLDYDVTPELPDDPYFLVLGQTLADTTVTQMAFGDYESELLSVIGALSASTTRPVVVKLHPFTDGFVYDAQGVPRANGNTDVSDRLIDRIKKLDDRVIVIRGITPLGPILDRSHCVVLSNSGAGIEALLRRRPIISWGCPEYHWATYKLFHLCDLRRAVFVEDWYDAKTSDQFITWYLTKYCAFDATSMHNRAGHLLSQLTYPIARPQRG